MSMGGTPNLLPDRWQQVYKQQEQMAQMAPGQRHCFGTRSEPMVMPLARRHLRHLLLLLVDLLPPIRQ